MVVTLVVNFKELFEVLIFVNLCGVLIGEVYLRCLKQFIVCFWAYNLWLDLN